MIRAVHTRGREETMGNTWTRARAAVFGAAVAGAMAVGGSAVAAEPRPAQDCYNPAAACRTPAECIKFCFPRGGRCNAPLGQPGCCACNR
jgi:hypothetical protein